MNLLRSLEGIDYNIGGVDNKLYELVRPNNPIEVMSLIDINLALNLLCVDF